MLNLESLSMERILLSADYPNLYGLDESPLFDIFNKKIESLVITLTNKEKKISKGNGLFKCVRQVSLFDQRPFEYEFFIRIAQAFPLLEKLSLSNTEPQKQQLINSNKDLPIIKYPHLIELDFNCAHHDYIEQFLMGTKTSLPDNIDFWNDYDSLKKSTHNLTRMTTRVNCAKIKCLHS